MAIWIILRTPIKGRNGKRLSMWDSDTGLARHGLGVGYVKSKKQAEAMVAYYRRYSSMNYRYQYQELDLAVKPKDKNKK